MHTALNVIGNPKSGAAHVTRGVRDVCFPCCQIRSPSGYQPSAVRVYSAGWVSGIAGALLTV